MWISKIVATRKKNIHNEPADIEWTDRCVYISFFTSLCVTKQWKPNICADGTQRNPLNLFANPFSNGTKVTMIVNQTGNVYDFNKCTRLWSCSEPTTVCRRRIACSCACACASNGVLVCVAPLQRTSRFVVRNFSGSNLNIYSMEPCSMPRTSCPVHRTPAIARQTYVRNCCPPAFA